MLPFTQCLGLTLVALLAPAAGAAQDAHRDHALLVGCTHYERSTRFRLQGCGNDVELMEQLAAGLGRSVEWRRMPFDELLPSVERGEVDVVCATLGITAERARRVLFSEPYFDTSITVVVRSGAGEPQSLAELAGRPVSAAAGTTSEDAVRRHLPEARGVFENKQQLATAERLYAGEVDGSVMDAPAADALVAGSDGRLVRLEPDLARERYALALPLDRVALKNQLDRELARLGPPRD